MEKKFDAEKGITLLAQLWANQNGVNIIEVTRRGSNEEVNNSANNSGFKY